MNVISTRYGKMRIIDADSVVSRSLAVYGEWAMDELNLLGQIIAPGMCVLDIGAFIGTHTLAFSEFVGDQGKVYSFEPRKEIYTILAENIALNNLKNVTSLNIGLAEKEDVLSLQSLDISQGINFGGLALDSNDGLLSTNTYQVRVSTIDNIDIEKLDVIKLDVEGMERRVLDGAIKTILRDRPVIFCECNSLIAGSEMLEFCKSVHYDVYGLLASAYNPKNFNAIKDNFFGAAKELALVLIPRENVLEVLRNIADVNLLPIHNLEDLVLPLLFKPQYPYEVLAHTASCASLGIDFPSPTITERDGQIVGLTQTITERDGQIVGLTQTITERDGHYTNLVNSTSWLITKPFRWFSRVCRGDFIAAADPFKKLLGLNDNASILLNSNLSANPSSNSSLVISAPIQPTHPTAVILPVYRGVEMTKSCILAAIPSILADAEAKLLAINDASPDVGMQEMLEQLAIQWPDRLLVLKNVSNLGFVRTVNRGLAYFSQYDVVLLNSDVIVPKDWLSRLINEAYSRPNIGTVTPFSNNSTICSFPYFNQENAQPFDLDVDSIDSVFKQEKLPCIEAPTGVGFCMYIRRACLDKVGYLNEEKFGRGYGEENDLCQRALKSGWLNLISPNIYAFHEGGVSFSSDKQALVDNAMRVIDELHPNYHSDVQRFIKSDPIKHARVTRYVQLLAAIAIPKVLHVSHSLGGGVKQHVEELGEYYGSRIANILLAPNGNKGEVSISLGLTPHADSLIFSIPSQYADMLALLKAIGISAAHFHHTIGLDSKLLQLSTDLSVARLITVHDYYWLFGNPTLTDEAGKYPGFYSDQLHNPLYPLPHGMTVKAWQESLRSFIEGADCVIFPSNSTKIIFDKVYQPAKPVVAPHIESQLNVNTLPRNLAIKDAYAVGVLGALGKEKGADILESLATKAKESGSNFNFKLIGYAYRPLKLVEKTGPYETKELKDLVKEHQLDILLFTAQWPETYSYTLSYALDSGLPIIAPNIGAFPERLSGRTNVVLFNHLSPASDLLNILNTFVEHMYKNSIVKAAVFENDISKHDFYSQDYLSMVSRDLKFTEISKQRPFHIDPTQIVAEGFMNKNSPWRNAVIHILWRLRMNPYLRWFTNSIPASVRRAVRLSLGGQNNHEIARGAKGK